MKFFSSNRVSFAEFYVMERKDVQCSAIKINKLRIKHFQTAVLSHRHQYKNHLYLLASIVGNNENVELNGLGVSSLGDLGIVDFLLLLIS